MNTITKNMYPVIMVVLAMVGFNSQAIAKTPDGQTPAIETVCNEYKDDVPGLYGLCNAICEAQDLDEFDKDPTEDVLNGNFEKRGGGYLRCGGGGEED